MKKFWMSVLVGISLTVFVSFWLGYHLKVMQDHRACPPNLSEVR